MCGDRALIYATLRFLYSHRIEVLHSVGCKSSSYLCSGCYACQGMPIAHRFAHGHNVWAEIVSLKLKSPEMMSHTPKTCLHFICHKHATSWAHISVENTTRRHHAFIVVQPAEQKQPDSWRITHSATLGKYPWGKIICPPTLGRDSAKKAEI